VFIDSGRSGNKRGKLGTWYLELDSEEGLDSDSICDFK
jgi:hypothetical protein